MASELRYSIEARTDIGRQRTVNEDMVSIVDAKGLGLQADAVFVLADGMGGMKAGDLASREAGRIVQEVLTERLGTDGADLDQVLSEAIRSANATVRKLAASLDVPMAESTAQRPNRPRPDADVSAVIMGTTCVAGVVRDNTLHLVHVGDSRAYLLRDGRMQRLTRDHSYVEERVLAGDLTEEEARRSKFRNMITRAIGIEDDVEPELRQESLREGDIVLVCTDGLTTMLEDSEIEAILVRADTRVGLDVERAVGTLIDAANRKGGADNVTVLLLHVRPDTENLLGASGSGGRHEAPPVVDFDAPSRGFRRQGAALSPFIGLLALVGALAVIALAALGLSSDVRASMRSMLGGEAPARVTSPDYDYTTLAYDAPEPFAKYLARGDVLACSSNGNLYFVGFASGRVAGLDRDGSVVGGVTTLPIAPPPKNPVPATTNYLATDAQGNVYLSLTARKVIEKRDAKGRVLKAFKGFQRPEAIAVDDRGNIYVVDFNQIKVLRARSPSVKKSATPAARK